MTVCIAVVCTEIKKVVAVSDEMISSDETSVEGVSKMTTLVASSPWLVMYAGTAANALPLIRRIKSNLPPPAGGRPRVPSSQIVEACEAAYKAELLKIVETDVLLPYGMTREDFFAQGRTIFPEYKFLSIVEQIERTTTDVALLIAGFDLDGSARVYEVSPWGVVKEQPLSFHAIGAGRSVALGALYSFPGLGESSDLYEILYRTLAAKFAAETAPSVGSNTSLWVLGKDGADMGILWDDAKLDDLRAIWLSEGQPPIPSRATEYLKRSVRLIDVNALIAKAKEKAEQAKAEITASQRVESGQSPSGVSSADV